MNIIARRYQILDTLGQGGMGTVYRAADRLTGQFVALKQVTVGENRLQIASRLSFSGTEDFRVALAQEFRTLASLRHPNIISVLDYGFYEDQPFFTMDLLPEPLTLLQAGEHRNELERLRLLVQVLQAVAYLHRRGILHRDLKPGNVLVSGDQVKVLDFGLAVTRTETTQIAGTLNYLAPEVAFGNSASERSDLYSLGVIAFELFAGVHPFGTDNTFTRMLTTDPDLHRLDLSDGLVKVIGRLLARDPQQRYPNVGAVIADLSAAIGLDLGAESIETRESFLQAAEFVGREPELAILTAALAQTDMTPPQGSAWLIGGESGVGKSRLLDELRIRAMINGVNVGRGQAISEGGSPYQLWRDLFRELALYADLTDTEAGMIKVLMPNIEQWLDREIPPITASQERLHAVITDIFARIPISSMLILEDLHWADADSLALLQVLLERTPTLPLLIVGSYRDDEAPDLPQKLGQMRPLKLARLDEAAIAMLSRSMLGESGDSPEIVELLQRETEGNVFFMVEVVRALAEEAGRLENIAIMTLPKRVLAGGVQTVIQRRLARLDQPDRETLKIAAAQGRLLDLTLIGRFQTDLTRWLNVCAEAAILEVSGMNEWRFAHDKLREALLLDFGPAEKQTIYRQVAEAVEALYPNQPEQFAALMHYHGMAGERERELHYALLAGDHAFSVYAYDDAIHLYDHAIDLAEQGETIDASARMRLFLQRGRACELKGDHLAAIQCYERLEAWAVTQPNRTVELAARAAKGTVLSLPNTSFDPTIAMPFLEQTLAMARTCADHQIEAKTLWNLMTVHRMTGNTETIEFYAIQAAAICRQYGFRDQLAYVLNDLGLILILSGEYERAEPMMLEAQALFRELNNLPLLTDNLTSISIYYLSKGDIATAMKMTDEAYQLSAQMGNHWGIAYSRMQILPYYVMQGDTQRAFRYGQEALDNAQKANFIVPMARSRVDLATLYLMLNDPQSGDRLLAQAEEDVRNAAMWIAYVKAYRAILAITQGDTGPAEALIAQEGKVQASGRQEYMFNNLMMTILRANVAFVRGNYEEVIRLFEPLEQQWFTFNSYFTASDFRFIKAQALFYLGETAAADQTLTQVLMNSEPFDLHFLLWEVYALQAKIHPDRATDLISKARQSILYIAEHTEERLRLRFLAHPEVAAIMNS
ncbi:MAG: protein kinase [Anaerolineae bacterium]|jgi:tetratricopeptide (TPR) repeat protein|nr:protein kinase [Anaerolineae bacterium]